MKRASGGRSHGFTIVETMIVLAVSGALFTSAIFFIGGRQQKAEFTASVRNFETSINDIANDVSDGYFADNAGTGLINSCTATGASITISTGATGSQGSRNDCILIGKAIQFAPSGSNGAQYNVMNLVGLHYKGGNIDNGDVTSYAESGVKAIAKTNIGDTSTPDGITNNAVNNGVTIGCVLYIDPAGTPLTVPPVTNPCNLTGTNVVKTDVIAFMTKLQGLDINNNQETGSASVDMLVPAVTTGALGRTTQSAATTLNSFSAVANVKANPAGGIYICLRSGGANQHALVKIGGTNSAFSAVATIRNGGCS